MQITLVQYQCESFNIKFNLNFKEFEVIPKIDPKGVRGD